MFGEHLRTSNTADNDICDQHFSIQNFSIFQMFSNQIIFQLFSYLSGMYEIGQ